MAKEIKEERNYYTLGEFLYTVIVKAKADPRWAAAEKSAVLDYMTDSFLRFADMGKTRIKNCEFDVLSNTAFGTSEGIYTDISLCGRPFSDEKSENAHVYTLKTLETNQDAYLAMNELGGLISWYAMEEISKNLDRFD